MNNPLLIEEYEKLIHLFYLSVTNDENIQLNAQKFRNKNSNPLLISLHNIFNQYKLNNIRVALKQLDKIEKKSQQNGPDNLSVDLRLIKSVFLSLIKELGPSKDILDSLQHEIFYTQFDDRIDLTYRRLAYYKINGDNSVYQGDYILSNSYLRKSMILSQCTNNIKSTMTSLLRMAKNERRLGKNFKCEFYTNRVLDLAVLSDSINKQTEALTELGTLYGSTGDNNKGIYYLDQALPLARKLGNKKKLLTNLNNIGMLHQQKGYLRESSKYIEEAASIAEELGELRSLGYIQLNLANIFVQRGDIKSSLKYFRKTMKNEQVKNNKEALSSIYSSLGALYDTMGEYEKANMNTLKSLKIARETKLFDLELKASASMVSFYYKEGKCDEITSIYEILSKKRNEFDPSITIERFMNFILAFTYKCTQKRENLLLAISEFEKNLELDNIDIQGTFFSFWEYCTSSHELYVQYDIEINWDRILFYLNTYLQYTEGNGIFDYHHHFKILLAKIKLLNFEIQEAEDIIKETLSITEELGYNEISHYAKKALEDIRSYDFANIIVTMSKEEKVNKKKILELEVIEFIRKVK